MPSPPPGRRRCRGKGKVTDDAITEYLAKKAVKKAKKVARKLKSQSGGVSGYANDSNPFGDSNLNESFVWRKKIEQDVSQGVPVEEFSLKSEKKRQRERAAEIEKVKKRREERAIKRAQREEEKELLARECDRAEFQEWEEKVEVFTFEQSKIRSEIRCREGRAKPIDILIKHLDPADDFETEINEPYMVFKGLNVKEMEELHNDIKMHLHLDRATPTHIRYWEALLVVSEWELSEAMKKDRGELIGGEGGLHMSLEADVTSLLQGKTYDELEALQSQIDSQMRSGTAKVVEYWEAVLKRLHFYKAKACLKEINANMLRKHLERVETQQAQELDGQEEPDQDVDDINSETAMEVEFVDDEELAGSYSPQLLHGDVDEDDEAIDPDEDKAILERKRIAVQEMSSRPNQPPEDNNFERTAMKAMGAMEEGDAAFGSNDEINLGSHSYWWHDKYRPRKPKYLNRVHTGYEWNKYNQTHYDLDNPPPKTVQGYKFNIFYPDLVEKSKVPTYVIEKDGDSGETCIIRFHAGPPYEDVAFRVVNAEWEYSPKKGFKCSFERGILCVYFNFKRYRYRR